MSKFNRIYLPNGDILEGFNIITTLPITSKKIDTKAAARAAKLAEQELTPEERERLYEAYED